MFQFTNRRGFIKTLVGGAASLSLSQRLWGQSSTATITATRLADNFFLVNGSGGNILIVTGPDGLLMVNGGLPETAADLMKFISDQFKGQRVQALFNTDWHLEHTGSNDLFKKAGAKIIAHENTKLWIGADFFSD